jgi:type II secretory pathway pseudopilin PulG
VVISIISILIAITFPFLGSMIGTSSVQVAENSVSSAAAGARTYATRSVGFYKARAGGSTSADDGDGYSGAAVLVTPNHELRLVQNDEDAVDDATGDYLELTNYNGYTPIDEVDQIRLPSGLVVLGIIRNDTNAYYGSGQITLLPPPFAIAFNNKGSMQTNFRITSGNADGFLIYDADRDGNYAATTTDDRSSFGGTFADFLRGGDEPPANDGFSPLPWEWIEPVAGMLIYDPDAAPANVLALFNPDDNPSSDPIIGTNAETILDWAADSGTPARVIFFNRYTGINIARSVEQ